MSQIARYESGDGPTLGGIIGAEVVPFLVSAQLTAGLPGDAELAWLRNVEQGVIDSPKRTAIESMRLLAPIEPTAILCTGENYVDHLDEKPPIQRDGPETFVKLAQSVIGPGDPIVYPSGVTSKLDYEVELGVVIGKEGRNIPVHEALDYVFGYTIVNDVTLRDRQVRMRPDGSAAYALGVSKSFDCSAPVGPVIVTRDEIPDPQSLKISSGVNHEQRQCNSTQNMISGVAEIIAYFSRFITLRPGLLLSTGTPGGTAWGTDPELGGRAPLDGAVDRYLRVGDQVECVIEKIGTLTNHVVAST